MREQIVDGKQIAGEHEYDGSDKGTLIGGLHVLQKEIYPYPCQEKMKNDQPVPDYRERKKQVEDMRRVKDARLQDSQERYAGVLVRVPEREDPAPQETHPEYFGRNEESGQVPFYEYFTTRQDSVKVGKDYKREPKKVKASCATFSRRLRHPATRSYADSSRAGHVHKPDSITLNMATLPNSLKVLALKRISAGCV
jgi:hypothetical protein